MRPIPKVEGIVVGLSLGAVGVLWTLANLGQLDLLVTLHRWWPSVLVLWGALELYNWRALAAQRDLPPPPKTEDPHWYDKDGESGRSA